MPFKFLNLRHLRAFREVAVHRRITIAVDAVHLSQPAITQAISKLERHLGVDVFERRPEGMFTTDPGEMFFRRTTRMFEHLSVGAGEAVRIANRRAGKGFRDFHHLVTAAQLRALIALSETGNFSLAARSVGVSQPSIHRAARDLERLSGMALFTTKRTGIELTPQAAVFARHVKLAAAELQQGLYEISAYKGRDSTRILVGSLPLSRTSILPTAIDKLLEGKCQDIQIRTIDGPYPELLRGLRFGEIDFIIGALRDPLPTGDVEQRLLFNDPLAVVVRANHPLAGMTSVTLDDTLTYPWIAPPKATPTGTYLTDVLRISQMPNTPVRIVSSSLVLVRGLMLRGDYITIMSLHQIALEQAQGILVPLELSLPDSARPIGLTFRKGWLPTPAQKRFLDLITEASSE